MDSDYARDIIIFGVDNSLSCHSEVCKDIFLSCVIGQLMVLMEALVNQKKNSVVI